MAFGNIVTRNNPNRGQVARRDLTQDPFYAMQREMDRMFDDFWRGFGVPSSGQTPALEAVRNAVVPSLELSEDDRAVYVNAELPGMNKDDIELSFADGVLTISGEKKDEREEGGQDRNFYHSERAYGAFQRAVSVGTDVDENGIDARFDNGVLKVTVPKSERARERTKKIDVKG